MSRNQSIGSKTAVSTITQGEPTSFVVGISNITFHIITAPVKINLYSCLDRKISSKKKLFLILVIYQLVVSRRLNKFHTFEQYRAH